MIKLTKILFFICFVFILICYQRIIPYNKIVIQAIFFSFIPSLLPCLILTNLLIENDTLIFLYNRLKKNKFTKAIYTFCLILISITLGMPSLQILLKNQYDSGIINKKSYHNFIYSFGTISFPFLYGVCLVNLPILTAIKILIIHYSINLFSLFFSSFNIEETEIKEKEEISLNSLIISIKKSFSTIAIISGTVIIFSLFLFALENIKSPLKWLLEGLIEFSYPLLKVSQEQTFLSGGILLFLSLFPSLSIIIQAKIINKDLGIKDYLIRRLLLAIFGVMIYLVFSF